MGSEVIVFIILGVLLVAGIALYANKRTIELYSQAMEVLEGGQLLKTGPFVSKVKGRWRGREVELWKMDGSNESPSFMHYKISGGGPLRLTLSPETATHKFAKKMGWSGIEIEVGDSELDDAFLIKTDHPEETKRLLGQAAARNLVLALLRDRYQLIEFNDEGLHARKTSYQPEDFSAQAVRERLEEFTALLQIVEGAGPPAAADFGLRTEMDEIAEAGVVTSAPAVPPPPQPSEHIEPWGAAPPSRPFDASSEPHGYVPLEPGGNSRLLLQVLAVVIGLLVLGVLYWYFQGS